MSTVREDIALIRKSVNSVNTDSRLTNKFIYDKLVSATSLIVRREAEMRKIYRSTELFKSLNCIEMIEDDIKSCTNIIIPGCTTISRSKRKIPRAFLTPGGSMIEVYSVDQSVKFIQTNISMYTDIAKREFKGNQRYFWIENDYIYIPEYISEVMLKGVFQDNSLVDKFNTTTSCPSMLNADSFIPSWLREDIYSEVIKSIAGVTKRIPEDENTNSNSNN